MRRAVIVFLLLSGSFGTSQTFTNLYKFCTRGCGDGSRPRAGLLEATDGNFYGTTSEGGGRSQGTVFKITPQGQLTTLHSFCSQNSCLDGGDPASPLVQAMNGDLYGTTYAGGSGGAGTVFKITLQGVLTTVHAFCSEPNCADGAGPYSGLLQAADGSLYGTTVGGGSSGTVFQIDSGGAFTTLHSFNGADGASPHARLIQGHDGNLYGTTSQGGIYADSCYSGCGTVFRITPTGTLTTLHKFDGSDGSAPLGELVEGADGSLYGTTSQADGHACIYSCGTIFRVTPERDLITLHIFHGPDGAYPSAGLVQDAGGQLYGTTATGGASNLGSVFTISPEGSLTTLHSFIGTDGASPFGGLVQASNGKFYGTTWGDPRGSNVGTVFQLEMSAFALIVNKTGTGSVSSKDGFINCGDVCGHIYNLNTEVTLTATPGDGWSLTDWSGCDTKQGNTCTVTINAARRVNATFTQTGYPLTVNVTGGGSVSSYDGFIKCGDVCSNNYQRASKVTLIATPRQGWALDHWNGCDDKLGYVCNLAIYTARTVSAVFIPTPSVAQIAPVILFVHGWCGDADSWEAIQGTLAPVLNELYPGLYEPDPIGRAKEYVAYYRTKTDEVMFQEIAPDQASEPSLTADSDARYFRIAFGPLYDFSGDYRTISKEDVSEVGIARFATYQQSKMLELAKVVAAIRKQTNIRPIILITHSMGGLVARGLLENLDQTLSGNPDAAGDFLHLYQLDTPNQAVDLGAIGETLATIFPCVLRDGVLTTNFLELIGDAQFPTIVRINSHAALSKYPNTSKLTSLENVANYDSGDSYKLGSVPYSLVNDHDGGENDGIVPGYKQDITQVPGTEFLLQAGVINVKAFGYDIADIKSRDECHVKLRSYVLHFLGCLGSFAPTVNYLTGEVAQAVDRVYATLSIEGRSGTVVGLPVQYSARISGLFSKHVTWSVEGNPGLIDRETGVFTPTAPGNYTIAAQTDSFAVLDDGKRFLRATLPVVVLDQKLLAGFDVEPVPTSLTLTQGEQKNVTVYVRSLGHFNAPVTLGNWRVPPGVQAKWSENPVTPPADGMTSTTLTISTDANSAPGSYVMTLRAESRGYQPKAPLLKLTVRKAGGQQSPSADGSGGPVGRQGRNSIPTGRLDTRAKEQ